MFPPMKEDVKVGEESRFHYYSKICKKSRLEEEVWLSIQTLQ